MTKKKIKYILGNYSKGHFEGKFYDDDEAWLWLSKRYLFSYPSKKGRLVMMHREEVRDGFKLMMPCKYGMTLKTKLNRNEVFKKCKETTLI